MKVVSEYISMVIQYNDSNEMQKHIEEMEKTEYKVVSASYGNLRARYRRELKNHD
jgi:hypothetical protein